jgi:hypothetical protein
MITNSVNSTQIGDYVYVSSNAGSTWTNLTTQVGNAGLNYGSTAMSSSGQYMLICGYNTSYNIAVSRDYGVTWNVNPPGSPAGRGHVGVSSTGQIMFVAANAGAFYSVDYGVTWLTTKTTGGILLNASPYNMFNTVAMSSDANYILIAQNSAGSNGNCYQINNLGTGTIVTISKINRSKTIPANTNYSNQISGVISVSNTTTYGLSVSATITSGNLTVNSSGQPASFLTAVRLA